MPLVGAQTLQYAMNRLAGTLSGDVPTRDAQGAANIWAGTTDLDLVHALNVKAGNAFGSYLELAGVLNQLAGTTGLGVDAAATAITGSFANDTFTRADSSTSLGTSTSGHVWSALSGTWGISSNRAVTIGANASAENVAVIDPGAVNCTITCDLTYDATAPGNWQRIVFRATDANNHYMVQLQGTVGFLLYKRVAGTYTQLAGDAIVRGSGAYSVAVVLSGTSITGKLNGTTIFSITDATYTTQTKCGLGGATNPAFAWDNFVVA